MTLSPEVIALALRVDASMIHHARVRIRRARIENNHAELERAQEWLDRLLRKNAELLAVAPPAGSA
jgi:hypothetical protein